MKYRSLSEFRQLGDFSFPLRASDTETFRALLYQRMPAEVYENEFWIRTLSSDSGILFMNWTDQSAGLAGLLAAGRISGPFRDEHNIRSHTFFKGFREFITPFLFPVLDRELRQSPMERWEPGLTFAQLLEEKKREDAEQIVYVQLQEEMEQFQRNAARAGSEEELVKAVQPYLRPSFINLLNAFGPSFYRARSNWMDALLGVAESPWSSRKLMLHIARQLEPLEMSKAHREELKQYDRDVRSGAIAVDKPEINWKRGILTLIGGAAVVVLIWVIWRVPSKASDKDEDQGFDTSYMSFTPEERAAMDSLLRQASATNEEQEETIDGMEDLSLVDIDLELRAPWKNKLADRLLNSWSKADTSAAAPDPKTSFPDKRAYPSTLPLSQKNGTSQIVLSNNTDISVFVMIFEDVPGGAVHTAFAAKKSALNFKVNAGDRLVALPGSAVPVQFTDGNLPFGQIDSEFYRQLGIVYQLSASATTAKLVWKKVNNSEFYLLDINGILKK
jgi:hypothetical protein